MNAKRSQNFRIEPFRMISVRHGINAVDILCFNNRAFTHITKQADFALLTFRYGAVAAAQENIRLNTDGAQLFHRVLSRLGFHLARSRNVGQQRQMHKNRLETRQVIAQLANGLEKRQGLNITNRTANLAQHEIDIINITLHEVFNRIRDMRNNLHRAAEIIAAPFFGYDISVNLTGGDIVAARGRHAGKAFIVTEIEIGLRPVIRHVNLAMLIR